MKIKDVAIRKINGGFIVSHYTFEEKKPATSEDGPCCMPSMGKTEEEYFTDEESAGKRIAELAKGMEKGSRY